MHTYLAYGLRVWSEFPLPELVADQMAGGVPDVTIRQGEVRDLPAGTRESGYFVSVGREETRLFLRGASGLLIRGGGEIMVEPEPGVSDAALHLFVLGPALAMVLHQRGNLVLHASAAGMRGAGGQTEVVAFLGESREGKSTMAAALTARGNQVVADDIVPIAAPYFSDGAGVPQVFPGFPVLKLWPEASEKVYGGAEIFKRLPPIAPHNPRRIREVREGFSLDALPLRRLYVLGTGDTIRSERLSASEALLELLRHSYWVSQLPPEQNAAHFRQCAVLAGRLPVYRLLRPRDLDLLSEVARVVEEDMTEAV